MTLTMWGATLGLVFAAGVLLVLARVATIRRTQLAVRVLPYVRDLPQVGRSPALRVASSSPTTAAAGVFGPLLRSAADGVERVLGGADVRAPPARARGHRQDRARVPGRAGALGAGRLRDRGGVRRAQGGGGLRRAAVRRCSCARSGSRSA